MRREKRRVNRHAKAVTLSCRPAETIHKRRTGSYRFVRRISNDKHQCVHERSSSQLVAERSCPETGFSEVMIRIPRGWSLVGNSRTALRLLIMNWIQWRAVF